MTTIVNGREVANRIQNELKDVIEARSLRPRLDILVVGSNPIIASFVAAKKRFANEINVEFYEHVLPDSSTTEKMLQHVRDVAVISDAIVVQLPLPAHIDEGAVLAAIPTEKDVDVLNEKTLEAFANGDTRFVPPVAGAISEILKIYNVPVRGKLVSIVGKGKLVGLPTNILLKKEGALIKVLDRSIASKAFIRTLKNSDIVISGAGVPSLIVPNMLKTGVVLIDAGTSSSEGSVKGDVSDECDRVASIISKTPGGVGPLTVALLFKNLIHTQVT